MKKILELQKVKGPAKPGTGAVDWSTISIMQCGNK